MLSTTTRSLLTACIAALLFSSVGFAQISVKRSGVVLYGATANCSQPATVMWTKVRKATSEWKTILSDGVRRGSGRYDLLISAMNDRIKKAVAAAADTAGRDCVVRKADLKSANGLKVIDLTREVVAGL